MQVPAYWPIVVGIQAIEKRGVDVDVKNGIAMCDISIVEEVESIDMDEVAEAVAEAIAMLLVIEEDIAVDMSMVTAAQLEWLENIWRKGKRAMQTVFHLQRVL